MAARAEIRSGLIAGRGNRGMSDGQWVSPNDGVGHTLDLRESLPVPGPDGTRPGLFIGGYTFEDAATAEEFFRQHQSNLRGLASTQN